MITLTREYEAEAAHHLVSGVPDGHKCRRLHGHRYVITVTVSGALDGDGMLIEYGDLDKCVRPIIQLIDHQDLNTLSERCSTKEAASVAANPTVERLLLWLATRFAILASARVEQDFALASVTLKENARSLVEWRP